jgi:hypothetical protein
MRKVRCMRRTKMNEREGRRGPFIWLETDGTN